MATADDKIFTDEVKGSKRATEAKAKPAAKASIKLKHGFSALNEQQKHQRGQVAAQILAATHAHTPIDTSSQDAVDQACSDAWLLSISLFENVPLA